MPFPLLHDPEPLRNTQTWFCKIPVIGWQVAGLRQEANEASLVRQAIDRGPVPESEWHGREYDKDIRAKLEKIVIANAYPKGATFHPDDPFELMMVLRYGDLNEVAIMMDIENTFGLDFNEDLYRRLVEEKMTFLQFIRYVESIPASQRTPKSAPDQKKKRLGRILSLTALAWLLLLPISAFFGLQLWYGVPTLLAIGVWLTIRIFGKLRRLLRKDLDNRERVFLRIAGFVIGTALGGFLMWQGIAVMIPGLGAVAVWFYGLLFISGGLVIVEISLGILTGGHLCVGNHDGSVVGKG